MKRALCMILAVIMLVGIVGCGTSEGGGQLTLGEVAGKVYTNDFVDVKFNMPDGWRCASEEELAQIMNISIESAEDEAEVLSKLAKCNLMLANSEDNRDSVQIMVENLTITGNSDQSVEDYLKSVAEQMKGFYDQYERENEVSAIETIKIGKHEYSCFTIHIIDSIDGATQLHTARKVDNYIINVNISSSDKDGIEALIDCFE